MFEKANWRLGCALLAFACLAPKLSAVIVEFREYHGRRVQCFHRKQMNAAEPCGTDYYARVFTGVVVSAADVGDTGKRLEIVPDEVFLGDSSNAMAITNQACLHLEIQVGDRWLFYLSRDPETDSLILFYDSPSKPVGEAGDEISMLRDLGRSTDSGWLTGTLDRLEHSRLDNTPTTKIVPLESHRLVVTNVKDGAEFSDYTNEQGRFGFELPTGDYQVTIAPEYGLREVEEIGFIHPGNRISVENHRCWNYKIAVESISANQ